MDFSIGELPTERSLVWDMGHERQGHSRQSIRGAQQHS